MISFNFANRIIFIFSLIGILVASYLFYEYTFAGSIYCPLGQGCDIVRASEYAHILGIPVPFLGMVYYFTMAILSVVHSHILTPKLIRKLQVLASTFAVLFGVYLTSLEAFVIRAYCFWCLISFIVSIVIFAAVLISRKGRLSENRN